MAKGGEEKRIIDFAPDPGGRRVAIARYEEKRGPEHAAPTFALSVVDIGTGAETSLAVKLSGWWEEGIVLAPPDLTWESSGKLLLAIDRDQKGYGTLIRIDASTGNMMRLKAKPAGERGVMRLRSVPGANRVLVNGLRGSILLDPQSGQYEEVKDIIGWYFSLPSPDGTRVLSQGTGGVVVYDTKSGHSETLAQGVPIGWSPDGQNVIFVRVVEPKRE